MHLAAQRPFAAGLSQTLVIWLLAFGALVTVRSFGGDGPSWHYSATVLAAALAAGGAGSGLLYCWHRGRARPRSAAGVRTGALLWPSLIIGVALLSSVVAMAISE